MVKKKVGGKKIQRFDILCVIVRWLVKSWMVSGQSHACYLPALVDFGAFIDGVGDLAVQG